MPASTLDPVNAALRTALSKSESLDNNNPTTIDSQLAGATKKALLQPIDFEPAGNYQNTVLDQLKTKYIVLKSTATPQNESPRATQPDDECEEILKPPQLELFSLDSVQLGWNDCDWTVGSGMVNMGNTCYLNSTLQALFHVPALVNWLMADKEHGLKCQENGTLCIICAMRKTLQDSQQRNASAIRPMLIYNKLRLVCRNLIPGRQEDAHEFLRYLVEAMEKSYLGRFKNCQEFDSKTKETTPLNQILGGYLRSAVRCLKCGHISTTFQHFQDLLLDIRKAQTIDEALDLYFSREKLDDESYQCESCNKKVPATKQFSLERAPMVLCLQLKRFSVTNNKITKHVNFRNRLDLTKFARHKPNVPLIYRFVALVTHMGPTVSCGHYTAVAQAPSGNFYQFDDSLVRPISHQAVFNTNAYIMLFELESSPYTQKNTSTVNGKFKLDSQACTSSSSLTINTISNNNNSTNSNGILSGSNSMNCTNNGTAKVGFTSDKIYGPQLPDKLLSNGTNNGNTNDSDSDQDHASTNSLNKANFSTGNGLNGTKDTGCNKVSSTPKKEADSSSNSLSSLSSPETPQKSVGKVAVGSKLVTNTKIGSLNSKANSIGVKTSPSMPKLSSNSTKMSPNSSKACPTSTKACLNILKPCPTSTKSNLNSKTMVAKSQNVQSKTKSLVPYESDDTSSNSSYCEDSSTICVSTSNSSTLGEWQVTSSTDIATEPSSDGKTWERKKTVQTANSTTNNVSNSSTVPSSSSTSSNNNNNSTDKLGSTNNTVVSELFKMSHSGYSAPVASWNGTRSTLDKEVIGERREDRKRALQADSSMDQGRTKHQKVSSTFKSNPGYNPIQEFHNAKNWNQNNANAGNSNNNNNNGNNNGHYKPFFNGGRHRRNFHYKSNNYHNKNYRFRQ